MIRLPRMTIRRLMVVIAIAAVLMVAGERIRRHFHEQDAIRARLLLKQKLIRSLGPAASPQEEY
jgi:hypothetical protein